MGTPAWPDDPDDRDDRKEHPHGEPDALGPPVAGVTEVAVGDDVFAPGAIAVPVGTTVT